MSPPPPEDWLHLDRAALLDALRAGHPVAPEALAGGSYLGVSLGLPGWVDRLAWKTFRKVFYADPVRGGVRGWTVRLEQRGLALGPQAPLLDRRGGPVQFGHYRVRPLLPDEAPQGVRQGVMLDYGQGGNRALDPAGWLRDPVVALVPGQVDWLLGWTYLCLPGLRLGTPSFFLLRREPGVAVEPVAEPPVAYSTS